MQHDELDRTEPTPPATLDKDVETAPRVARGTRTKLAPAPELEPAPLTSIPWFETAPMPRWNADELEDVTRPASPAAARAEAAPYQRDLAAARAQIARTLERGRELGAALASETERERAASREIAALRQSEPSFGRTSTRSLPRPNLPRPSTIPSLAHAIAPRTSVPTPPPNLARTMSPMPTLARPRSTTVPPPLPARVTQSFAAPRAKSATQPPPIPAAARRPTGALPRPSITDVSISSPFARALTAAAPALPRPSTELPHEAFTDISLETDSVVLPPRSRRGLAIALGAAAVVAAVTVALTISLRSREPVVAPIATAPIVAPVLVESEAGKPVVDDDQPTSTEQVAVPEPVAPVVEPVAAIEPARPKRERHHRPHRAATTATAIAAPTPRASSPKAVAKTSASVSAAASSTGTGTLMVSAKPPCELVIDGKVMHLVTPQRAITLPAGAHQVTFINTAQNIRKTVPVSISGAKTSKLIQDFTQR